MASAPPTARPQQESPAHTDAVRALVARLVDHHNSVDPPFAPRRHPGGEPARRRIIAVVGAGASYRAGLPLARESITTILEQLRIDRGLFEDVVSAVATRRELELRRGEFETNLFAISLIPGMEDRLRDVLQKLYSRGSGVLLTYEVLAHLLKHRFLDAIVNFNFDELLDRAISDELQPDEFRYVWSDGHCPSPDEDPLDLPLYIKPHGTVSHKSTLRFTREAYLGIPTDISQLLRSLLTEKPVTLLVIGFGMQSVEFNQILSRAKSGLEIFYLNIQQPRPEPAIPTQLTHLIRPVRRDLDRAMDAIWKLVERQFSSGRRPRGLDRHRIVARVFPPQLNSAGDPAWGHNDWRYLQDRLVLELALSIAKGKGLVNMRVLINDRCGRYFERLCRAKRPHSVSTLYEFCTRLRLYELHYGREMFSLDRRGFGVLKYDQFRQALPRIVDAVADALDDDDRSAAVHGPLRQEIMDVLAGLYRDMEVELRACPSSEHFAMFSSLTRIHTMSGLHRATLSILGDPRWDVLLVSAETGEWLAQLPDEPLMQRMQAPPRRVLLVVADAVHRKRLERLFGERLIVRQLVWSQHNRHMTIALRRGKPLTCIYFNRRHRSAEITPVLLNKEADSGVALDSFAAYWWKSERADTDANPSRFPSLADLRDWFSAQLRSLP